LFWKKDKPKDKQPEPNRTGFFSTDVPISIFKDRRKAIIEAFNKTFQVSLDKVHATARTGEAMDSSTALKPTFYAGQSGVPDAQFFWYGSQGFIGYQACAMIAQNWLVDKCCSMPARDAIRVGYDITVTDSAQGDLTEPLEEMSRIDKLMKIDKQVEEFIRMNRVFGIRIALPIVESTDPDYYENPFNPDGVTPGSYKGISQVDPYWITPELDAEAVGNPASMYFYEPTWWRINGVRYHRSHLIIARNSELADVLKPSYIYGGISVPQKIYERVYASERTANEAPMLAMTKRLNVQKVDIAQALANQDKFEQRALYQNELRDNFGKLFIGLDEEVTQLDTSLADLDAVIMTQYQLVASAANVPATKLLGTVPKGFNSTGDYEESSYHEELESIQEHEAKPLLDRHHLLVMRSYIAPKFGIKPFSTGVSFGTLDSMTAAEQATVNYTKAQTDALLVTAGAIDGEDIRGRVIADPDSGYNGISDEIPEAPEVDETAEPDDNEAE